MSILKLWQFTDTHLYARNGQPQDHYSCAILDAGLEAFLNEPNCGILLISGDLTQNGHADEHRALIPRLRRVQEAGKRVYVITATHDYGLDFIEECPDDGANPLDRPNGKMYQSDLRGLYDEFGFRDAIAEFGRSSYVARLAPNVRLLALNDDGDGREFCGYYEEQMRWAIEQIERAKQNGEIILGMTHHPTIPPSPIYPMISARDMLGNYEETTDRLGDAGLRAMFTGHTHMHNIAAKASPNGNPYRDINTCSLSAYPGYFREITLDGRRMSITTKTLPNFHYAPANMPINEFLEKDFDSFLRNLIENAANDYETFANSCGGLSVSYERAMKMKFPLHYAAKYINKATLGSVARLLLCKIPKGVKKQSFKELFLELVRNIYAGNEKYGPETEVGQALTAFARRADRLIGKRLPDFLRPLPAFVSSLIYDPIPDDKAEIDL